ncbi:MAG: HAD-IA family hydrolase [Hyphomicrobiales bacterium]|nr:HAD-IA family hydrolase [Hyphomicrobiales bacterium]
MARAGDDPPCFRSGDFDAALFDLDGVLTDTASLHAAVWKVVFDAFLSRQAESSDTTLSPFSIDDDYLTYVDGKPRYEGVASFLQSRGFTLPWGSPDDEPGRATICGLGNQKNVLFRKRLRDDGVRPIEFAVDFVRALKSTGIKSAVVTSSRNGTSILAAAKITDLFDVTVDGVVAARLGLKGKPDPATFLEAARRLGVEAGRAAVVEDAVAGVQAGRDGGFGLVIGVDRKGRGRLLRENGADIVVYSLTDIKIESTTRENPPIDDCT